MTDVSVIGLGSMGSAIARALLAARCEVTVWNRTRAKTAPLTDHGATCAGDIEAAIAASPLIVICIDDYAATHSLLRVPGVENRLSQRILVQFSTGTPAEARALEHWAQGHNAAYLDGAILAYPREVGGSALILVSGDSDTFERCRDRLQPLSDRLRYLGPSVGAAAALDTAMLSYYACTHLGLIHGALICESEDVRPDLFASFIADSLPSDIAEIRHLGEALQRREFTKPSASLGVYAGALDRILSQAADAGVNTEIPSFVKALYQRGIDAGLADEEVVALTTILKN